MGNSKTAKTRRLFMYRQYESNDVLYFYTVPVKLLGWAQAAGSYTPCYQQHLHHGWSDGCWRHRRRDDGCLLLEPDTCNLVFSLQQCSNYFKHLQINRNSGGPHTFYFIFILLFLYFIYLLLFRRILSCSLMNNQDDPAIWFPYRATNSASLLFHL